MNNTNSTAIGDNVMSKTGKDVKYKTNTKLLTDLYLGKAWNEITVVQYKILKQISFCSSRGGKNSIIV